MKQFFYAALSVLIALALCGCGGETPGQFRRTDTAMGTVVQQNIYAVGSQDPTEEISGRILELEQDTLSWRTEGSEVGRANQSAGSGEGFLLTELLGDTLRRCERLGEDSEGAFDVTLGPVARLWDIDGWADGLRQGSFQVPDQAKLDQALALCGRRKMTLEDSPEGTLLYLEEGAALDLGAVGKGLALDEIRAYLEGRPEVTGAVVSVGGSVLTYGEKPDGSPWRVGIADPFEPSGTIGVLSLEGQWCVSTSGDYERYVEADGVRYHHILDPATGYPAESGVRSVTVLTKDGFYSDALSTACFVLGREKGSALAQRYGAEVLFVSDDGEIFLSEGMEERFQGSGQR